MPSRWWVSLPGIDPRPVRLQHVHAAVSGWFDQTEEDHAQLVKPYALSPLSHSGDRRSGAGFEASALTDQARECLLRKACSNEIIRLGAQTTRLVGAQLIEEESWDGLQTWMGGTAWDLEFVTPATFRQGQRWSPWPAPATVLRGLSESWNRWSDTESRTPTHQQSDAVWVAELSGSSQRLDIGPARPSGFLGHVRYQCEDQAVASLVDGLFRLAAYAGVGSAKAKGLGVTRVHHAAAADGARSAPVRRQRRG